MIAHFLCLVFIGLFAGFMGSSVGASGTNVLLPGLLISGIVKDYKTALGTSLFTILAPLSIGAVYVYWKDGRVQVTNSIVLMIAYFISATFTSIYVVKYLPEQVLVLFYAIFLFLSSMYFFHTYFSRELCF
jgi:uncharacterized membrane protein YfcA